MARARLFLPKGVVLTEVTEEAHQTFLEASGVLKGMEVAAWRVKVSPVRTRMFYQRTPSR